MPIYLDRKSFKSEISVFQHDQIIHSFIHSAHIRMFVCAQCWRFNREENSQVRLTWNKGHGGVATHQEA